ncbi:MAG: transposase [Spirochaetaceae bacterium]|nr:transposase [Spirochaetaceae bacterium]
MPGCGAICSVTIRAYVDGIKRFASGKKFAAYCGLVPWTQNSGVLRNRGPRPSRQYWG